MIEAVISFFGLIFGVLKSIFVVAASGIGEAAGAGWTFTAAWYPEILIAAGIAVMLYLVVRHGKRGTSHRGFEWGKLLSEFGHLLKHPNPVGVLLLVIGLIAVLGGGHRPNHPGGGAPPNPPTHQV